MQIVIFGISAEPDIAKNRLCAELVLGILHENPTSLRLYITYITFRFLFEKCTFILFIFYLFMDYGAKTGNAPATLYNIQ